MGFGDDIIIIRPVSQKVISVLGTRSYLCRIGLRKLSGNRGIGDLAQVSIVDHTLGPCTSFSTFVGLTRRPRVHFIVSGAARTKVAFSPTYGLRSTPTSSCPNGLARLLCRHCGAFGKRGSGNLVVFPYRLVFLGKRGLGRAVCRCVSL